MGRWFSAHTHSNFSTLDGMTTVESLVAKAHLLGAPAFALTDHGNMAGVVQGYKATQKRGMPFFPGVEAYLIDPKFDGLLEDSGKEGRYHMGIMALDLKGYQALVRFVSKTHTRPRFNRFPRCTLGDLAELAKEAGEHVAITTGCFFGYVQQTLIREDEKQALKIVKMLAAWFPHTFVELQNHNIEHTEDENVHYVHDDDIVESMIWIAGKAGLPVLATQDSHYCDQKQKGAHALMKRMVYGGIEDAFPGDSFHYASEEWVAEHYDPKVWEQALQGCDELLSLNSLKIPPLDKFEAHVPSMAKKPNTMLRKLCIERLDEYLDEKGWQKHKAWYIERLFDPENGEYQVIKSLGMANYFLFVLNGVTWCRRKGFAVEARGSANGSLVCFLLGITQIDPRIHGTIFERFLSRDRIYPPDIDIDIEDIARQFVLGYRAQHFETLQIGTFSELGARASDQKGSVMATYSQYLRRMCIDRAKDRERRRAERCAEGDCRCPDKCAGKKPVLGRAEDKGKADYRQQFGWIQTLDDVRQHNKDDWYDLMEMAEMRSVRKSYGVHASGVLVAGSDMTISDWVPTMLVASSDTHVTQYDMKDVEQFGMLKEDWLGQRTLAVMRRCQELIGEVEDPTDFSWIPNDDPAACKMLREGRTENGIFHFEGYTKAKGGKEMGIQSTNDAILATALYMPGATESGQKDHYLKYRKGAKQPKYLHPIFEEALKDTYGAVIYQEQPLAICRSLGMSIETINQMFKIVKDSGKGAVERNRERLKAFREEFDEHCLHMGLKVDQLDEAWFLTTGFINYGFNRAHASGYGLRSYRCAYLKAHYPLEFMSALLENWAGDKKEAVYAREARRIKIRILPPDVNISGAIWTMDKKGNAIRRGLTSVAGIGVSAAEEIAKNAPYKSVTEIAKKCNPKKVTGGKAWLEEGKLIGSLRKLEDAGALDQIDHSLPARKKLTR